MNKITYKVLIFISLLSANGSMLAQKIMLYGTSPESYVVDVLELALSYSPDKTLQVETYLGELPKTRAFENMRSGKEIDVVFGGATKEREQAHLPIRYPLLKGLNGWRIPLIHKKSDFDFSSVSSIEQLRAFKAGSYYNWSDTDVMLSNDLPVVKASNYAALYSMLERKRFDYFPRSILEIDGDYDSYQHLDIKINNDLIIYYPTAYYFYVRKDNTELAEVIKTGLLKAHNDGSLDSLFLQHHGEKIKRYTENNPTIIRLSNTFLSSETPDENSDFWYQLPEED